MPSVHLRRRTVDRQLIRCQFLTAHTPKGYFVDAQRAVHPDVPPHSFVARRIGILERATRRYPASQSILDIIAGVRYIAQAVSVRIGRENAVRGGIWDNVPRRHRSSD